MVYGIPGVFAQQGVGIGTNKPHESAVLDVFSESDTKGVLIPRISDRGNVANPTEGLIIYHELTKSFEYFDGSQWIRLVASPSPLTNLRIENISDGINAKDALNKRQLDTKVTKSGDTMSGTLSMGANRITNVANGVNLNDAVNKGQLDEKANRVQNAWVDFTGFANGWTSWRAFPVQYFKDELGFVHWRGRLLTTNATSSVISTAGAIPDGLAPPPDLSGIGLSSYSFVVAGWDGDLLIIPINIETSPNGTARISMRVDDFDLLPKTGAGYIQLDHISYDTRDF
ncbi:MAG: hypothetical protein AAGA66_18050 [Bacteroidota bacterium]